MRKLGQVLLKTDRKSESVQALERAVRARPSDPETWQMLAEARGAAGDGAGSLKAQRRVASLSPGNQKPSCAWLARYWRPAGSARPPPR